MADLKTKGASPGNLNVSFAWVEGEALLLGLRDIALSSGSACTSAGVEPSYVLRAIGVPAEMAHTALRFGIGRTNTEDEIDRLLATLVPLVRRLREMSPLAEMARQGIDPRAAGWERDDA